MKRFLVSLGAICILGIFVSGLVLAQSHRDATQKKTWHISARGWGAGEAYNRWYNPSSVTSVRGEVIRVEIFQPAAGMSVGLELIVKTDTETIPVHLGPLTYLKEQGIKFEPKDGVEVKGSRVTLFNRQSFIIAAQVIRGSSVLKLRDEKGLPLW